MGLMYSRFKYIPSAILILSIISCSICAQNKSEIFIPLQNRNEVKISPDFDTLLSGKEYSYIMKFAPKYKFSELFFDKGVAVRTDSLLRITPKTKKTSGLDTAMFKIIGFANNSRILLYQYLLIKPEPKLFPNFNSNKGMIVLNNMALERNEKYKRNNFSQKAILSYEEPGRDDTSITILSVTLSLVNKQMQKNLYKKGDKLDEEMIKEIRKLSSNTLTYIKLEVKIGKKTKSVWTRFMLTV